MEGRRIAVVSPSSDAVSETFVRSHVHGLNGKVFHYYGGHMPKKVLGGEDLMRFDLLSRLKRKLNPSDHYSMEESAVVESFRMNRIQAVLAEYGPTGARLTKICKEEAIPLVVHFHGYDASQYDIVEKYRDEYAEMFRSSHAIVAVSLKMKEMLIELGAAPQKLHVLPCAPNPEFFSIDRTKDVKGPHFLFLGRFVDKKAPHYVLLAFNELLGQGVKAHLTMAGDGPLYSTVKSIRDYYGLQAQVDMPGAVSHDQVKALMQSATCYVQHSVKAENGDMEGTPVSIVEAAASGILVISTRHAGIPDVIKHGETGFLVDEHDVHMMATYMKRSLEQVEEAKTMGLRSRENIRLNFSHEKNIKDLDQLMTQAISKR